jgi:hypothetical protein
MPDFNSSTIITLNSLSYLCFAIIQIYNICRRKKIVTLKVDTPIFNSRLTKSISQKNNLFIDFHSLTNTNKSAKSKSPCILIKATKYKISCLKKIK